MELDEYAGISLHDPRNLFAWLQRDFISKVDYQEIHLHRFISDAPETEKEIMRMEETIRNLAGIDLVFLGLGPNGHVGFNEPGSTIDSTIRVVELSEASQISNSKYWGKSTAVPQMGFTLGIATILQARKIVLLVQGKQKTEILQQTLHAPISSLIPSTFLRTRQDLIVLADKDAAAALQR